ncbi:unnamed protein product [Staurois parvus]|uniref:Uncharacterized protein n=1 Tax=Staurois parvus TaxID=386267 RepID=A0ABN9DNF8_9NEOB|nr:unnamed protein product [Staurois parvus]
MTSSHSLGHSGSPINGKSRRCRLSHVISCVQSQLITSVPPVSVHQCQLSVLIHATCKCPSVPHFNAYQCTSMPHISAHLSCLSVSPISATYQCQSVPPISAASQCRLSVQVPPISASQCRLTVTGSAAYQCHI